MFDGNYTTDLFDMQYPELWDGCIGAWCPALGPTGLSLIDWSGFQNHGVLTNFSGSAAAWLLQSGYWAIDPDGTNDFVSVANHGIHNPGDRMSVAAWIYLDAAPGANGGVVSKSAATSNGWALYVGNSGGNLMTNFGIHSTTFTATSSSSTFPAGALTHLCGTYDGTTLRVFVNGRQNGNGSAKTGSITTSSTALSIGNLYAASQPINGKVFDVMLWNRALTAQEIATLAIEPATAYLPRFSPWPVDQGNTTNRRRRFLIGSRA